MSMYDQLLLYVQALIRHDERQQDAILVGGHIITRGLESVLRIGIPEDRVPLQLRLEGFRERKYPGRVDKFGEFLDIHLSEHIFSGRSERDHKKTKRFVTRGDETRTEYVFTEGDRTDTLDPIDGYEKACMERGQTKNPQLLLRVVHPRIEFHFGYTPKSLTDYISNPENEHNTIYSELMKYALQLNHVHYSGLEKGLDRPDITRRHIAPVLKRVGLKNLVQSDDISPDSLIPMIREFLITGDVSLDFLKKNGLYKGSGIELATMNDLAQATGMVQQTQALMDATRATHHVQGAHERRAAQDRGELPKKEPVPEPDGLTNPAGFERTEGGLFIAR
ncbi:MAG: hypothetical protein V1740_00275 [Candidatus Woesearchaeota archaeon]